MKRNKNSIIWNPGELIYEIGSIPEEAYLILEGYVNIETKDQFKLNTLGKGEVFGESSLLLGTKRTVTARADSHKVVANIIPKDYFLKLKNNDLVLSALIRKTQVRLMNANEKINQLANEVSELLSSLKGNSKVFKLLLLAKLFVEVKAKSVLLKTWGAKSKCCARRAILLVRPNLNRLISTWPIPVLRSEISKCDKSR